MTLIFFLDMRFRILFLVPIVYCKNDCHRFKAKTLNQYHDEEHGIVIELNHKGIFRFSNSTSNYTLEAKYNIVYRLSCRLIF